LTRRTERRWTVAGSRCHCVVATCRIGGLVLKAHIILYHSTLELRVIKKKKRPAGWAGRVAHISALAVSTLAKPVTAKPVPHWLSQSHISALAKPDTAGFWAEDAGVERGWVEVPLRRRDLCVCVRERE